MPNSYEDKFCKFVKTKLAPFYQGIGPFYAARNKDGSSDSLTYFFGHLDRFKAMIAMCQSHIDYPLSFKMAELGSFYPYVSYYLKLQHPTATIDLYDIILREHCAPGTEPYDVDGIKLIDFNFCIDEFPDVKYDLIFLSEVMEHLPMNLHKFAQKVSALLNPGGHLLVTYPLQGKDAKGYSIDLAEYDHNKLQEGHIREFTEETVPMFFQDLTKVAQVTARYKAYGEIKLVLYRK